MVQSVPIILDIKQKVRQSYLCTCTLFAVALCNLSVELYSIIWILKKVDVYFLQKKLNRSFTYCCQCFKCVCIKAADRDSSTQFILDNTLF